VITPSLTSAPLSLGQRIGFALAAFLGLLFGTLIMMKMASGFFMVAASIAWSGLGTGRPIMTSPAMRLTFSLMAATYVGFGTLVLLTSAFSGAYLWNVWPRPVAGLSAWMVAWTSVLGMYVGILSGAVLTQLGLDLTVGLVLATVCTAVGAYAGSSPMTRERPLSVRVMVFALMAAVSSLLAALYVRLNA
jgi:hypothetical protein